MCVQATERIKHHVTVMKNTVPSYRADKWVVIKPGTDNLSAKDPALWHTRRVAAKIQHITFTPLLHINSP